VTTTVGAWTDTDPLDDETDWFCSKRGTISSGLSVTTVAVVVEVIGVIVELEEGDVTCLTGGWLTTTNGDGERFGGLAAWVTICDKRSC
jgi:hypothetical protein